MGCDLRRLRSAAAAKGKTVIALKVGRSEQGRAAVQAHTGALAGEDALYDAYFRRYGIVRVDDLDEMIETAAMFSARPKPPAQKGFVPVTFSGGHAAMLADIAQDLNLPLAALSERDLCAAQGDLPDVLESEQSRFDAWGTGWDPGAFREDAGDRGGRSGGGNDRDDDHAAADAAHQHRRRDDPEPGARQRSGKCFALINDSSGGPREPGVTQVLAGTGIAYLSGLRNGMTAIARWLNAQPPPPASRGDRLVPEASAEHSPRTTRR